MANLLQGTPVQPYGLGGRAVFLPVQASAQIWEGSLVSQINGACVSAGAAGAGHVVAVAKSDMLGGATDGANRLEVLTDQIFVFPAGTNAPTDATPYGTVLYAEDDNHVGTGSGSETVIAGRFVGIQDDGNVRVFVSSHASWFDTNANPDDGGTSHFKARAVITSIAAYDGSTTGVLTGHANGAIGTQDGVTLAVGDLVLLPAGITHITAASDAGPYVVTTLGNSSPGAKFVLTRPSWWQTGAPIAEGQVIQVSGEGTLFGGSQWKALCAKGKVVDTDDAALYPQNMQFTVTLASGTYSIGHGGGGEQLYLRATSNVQATLNTPGGTLGTNRIGAPSASRVTGYPSGAVIVVNSYVDAGTVAPGDTSTVDVLVSNW